MNELHPSIEELTDYLHGELPPGRDAAVHAHVAACPECARAQAEEQSLTELLRAHARAEERELPERVVAKIRSAAFSPPRPSAWERLRSGLRPAFALPAAAAAAIAIYLGLHAGHGTARATSIGAAYYVDNHAALTATAPFAQDEPLPATLTSDSAPLTDERPVDETR